MLHRNLLSYLLLLFFSTLSILAFDNCTKDEPDNEVTDLSASRRCNGLDSCVTIKGRFTTDDTTKGIPGIRLELRWRDYPSMFAFDKDEEYILAHGATGTDGSYSCRFTVTDEEGGGYFFMTYTLPEDTSGLLDIWSKGIERQSSFLIEGRDTTVTQDFLFPRKAYIRLTASDPASLRVGRIMRARVTMKAGPKYNDSTYKEIETEARITEEEPEVLLPVAANQQIRITSTSQAIFPYLDTTLKAGQ